MLTSNVLLTRILGGIYCLEGMTFRDDPQINQSGSWSQTLSFAPTPGDFSRERTPSVFCPSPEHVLDDPHTPFGQSQPNQLGFFQEPERNIRLQSEQSYIHYMIEWKVTLNNRTVSKDTEQDLVIAPSSQ